MAAGKWRGESREECWRGLNEGKLLTLSLLLEELVAGSLAAGSLGVRVRHFEMRVWLSVNYVSSWLRGKKRPTVSDD